MVLSVEESPAEQWHCPARAATWVSWASAVEGFAPRARSVFARYGALPAIFGLELRTTYAVLQDHTPVSGADNAYWREKTAFLYRRPAVEPIMLSFWKRHRDHRLDAVSAVQVATLLTGRSLGFRHTGAVGRSARGSVRFEPVEVARTWLPSIQDLQLKAPMISDWPVYVYARTIMAHPLEDGNGRLARLLFAATLAAQLRLERPCIAFSPSFYRYAEGLSAAITTLSRTGDWLPVTTMLRVVVEDALTLTLLSSPFAEGGRKPDG
jgi:hypothetical protein